MNDHFQPLSTTSSTHECKYACSVMEFVSCWYSAPLVKKRKRGTKNQDRKEQKLNEANTTVEIATDVAVVATETKLITEKSKNNPKEYSQLHKNWDALVQSYGGDIISVNPVKNKKNKNKEQNFSGYSYVRSRLELLSEKFKRENPKYEGRTVDDYLIITFLAIATVAFAQSTESSAASASAVATATASADASASASAAGPVATGAPTVASIEAALQALPVCASTCLIAQYPSLVAAAAATDPTAQAALLEKEVGTICADATFATVFTKCITAACTAADLEQSKTAAPLIAQGCALLAGSSNVTASVSATTQAAVATTAAVATSSKSGAFSTVLAAGCAAISLLFL
ncbi:UNVERIFIED_CONTAM: hypothetical protein HDU68_012294 [Siphonaria sp. JEL0065]|nr:hypothetical protein HDU68_012294 [Siphonaria sp. JEL0065]